MAAHVLLIDDDARLASMVVDYLCVAGLDVQVAGSLEAARQKMITQRFDVAVLDLMLPDGNGLELCREWRAQTPTRHLPVLMLTARGEPMDRVVGLEMGADDYLGKPFEPRELLARVRALLRRVAGGGETQASCLRFGRLEINLDERVAQVDGRLCELTNHQFALLWVLAQHPGRVLSRERIMDALKGQALEAFDRSIDVHVSRIRAAIEDDPKQPKRVLTVRGAGYLFVKTQT